jgi:hypothetical protein
MVVVVVALCLGILLGISALVVDLGYLGAAQAQLQAAADAASHAGAMQLDGTADGVVAAEQAAIDLASFNTVAGEPVVLDPSTGVETGVWDIPSSTFTPGGTALEINAVRVLARRDDLPAWFANAAFGEETLAASVVSVAHKQDAGAAEVECFIPLGIPGCLIDDVYGMDGINMVDLVLNPPGVNNVAWARPGANPNANWLRSQLWDCEQDGSLSVDDSVDLNNGVINSALKAMADEVEASGSVWDTDLWGPLPSQHSRSGIKKSSYGNTLEGPIAVYEDDAFCSSPGPMNGTYPVAGFVWGAIYDVATSGPAAQRTIRMRIDTTQSHEGGTQAGGTNYGIEYRHLALVY